MVDTTTTNYALTKPTVGADADAWGGILNTDLDQVDAALSGVAPIHLNGLTLSAAGSTGTFGVASGGAGDASGALMLLASAYTKTTSAWAVGTGNGALDTGSIANNTWYHAYLIKRVDTGVVDLLVSLSATAPTLPTNYTLKRRIGSMLTDGSAHWVKFLQVGDQFLWSAFVLDANALSLTGNQSLTLTVPSGVIVDALMRANVTGTAGSQGVLINSLAEAATSLSDGDYTVICQVTGQVFACTARVQTNSSAQIRIAAAGSVTLSVGTYGWIDTRGKI